MKSRLSPLVFALAVLPFISLFSCATPPNRDGVKPVILAVSFGTSYADTREKTIGAIENAIAAAHPDYEVRRAFTSQIIINVMARRDNIKVDNVNEAMDRLVADKVTDLVVQPTHIMNGFEYDEMIAAIKPYESKFARIRYGRPLMSQDRDFTEVSQALIENTRQYSAAADTAVVFMGHGTEHNANQVYTRLEGLLKNAGAGHYFVGTVEAEPTLEEVIAGIKSLNVSKVVMLPFMIVAGDHANNDMAGDEEDSWKSILEAEGYEVTPVLRGLGEYPKIREIFARHAGEAGQL